MFVFAFMHNSTDYATVSAFLVGGKIFAQMIPVVDKNLDLC